MIRFVFFFSNFYIEVFSRKYWSDISKRSKIDEKDESTVEDEELSPTGSTVSGNGSTGFAEGNASQSSPADSDGHSFQQCNIKED